MPAQYATLTRENKAHNIFDIDQFRLEPKEQARILILDPAPVFIWAHYITTPNEERRGKYAHCLGDNDTLMTGAPDATRCVGCAFVAANPESDHVSRSRRRFALHIARYRTNKHGEVLQPLSLGLEIWVFGDDKFGKLVDRTQEHGDLRKHDIRVTCTSAQFQQYDLDVSPQVLALQTPAGVEQYKALAQQRSGELERVLGTHLSAEKLEALISGSGDTVAVRDTAAVVADAQKVFDDIFPTDSPVEASVDALLTESTPEADSGETTEAAPEAAKVDFDDLFKDL